MNWTRAALVTAAGTVVASLAIPAASQMAPSSVETRERMRALAPLVGEWEGEARMQMGPDTREVISQQEQVEWAAGGEALLVRGLGRVGNRVVHDAIAVIAWDARAGRYAMWTYRAGGAPLAPEISVSPDGYTWSFAGPGSAIRFIQRFDQAGRWIEKGERSPDQGKTWIPFFDMRLTKRSDDQAPAREPRD